ncbi:MAG TPA: outer membrane beta-barrel protein [Puia sp.]|jgi:hypothetical protein|nr:outer membrane beta-barrel protein [Puia sp.]
MKNPFLYIFLMLANGMSLPVFAQGGSPGKADSTLHGTVIGRAFDSAHNYSLHSATVALYNSKDSFRLLTYGLTDNFGRFTLSNVPIDTAVRLVLSYTGYEYRIKTFSLSRNHPSLDLGTIALLPAAQSLQEAHVVFIPPVRLNNDTLEFNPRAFSMDKNAVVEDLLRQLPGITVWGDGSISVNGRVVKSVLVNGKPFFGGGARIATQNIPKESVDKIQSYQRKEDPSNTADTITEINIKLKKESSRGIFGKVGAGIGTDQRKEGDAALNFFSPQTQLALVGAGNNVNKVASDVKTLIENSTYKGVGTALDYQPDLRSPGQTTPTEIGFTFQQDFLPVQAQQDFSRLSSDYFYAHRRNNLLTSTLTTTALNAGNSLFRQDSAVSNDVSSSHSFNSKYEHKIGNGTYNIGASLQSRTSSNDRSSSAAVFDRQGDLQSRNQLAVNASQQDRQFNVSGAFGRLADLSFSAGNSNTTRHLNTAFNSYDNSSPSSSYDRAYYLANNFWDSRLFFTSDKLISISIKGWQIAYLDFQNELVIHGLSKDNKVYDVTSPQAKLTNGYLTAKNHYFSISDIPAAKFSRGFGRNLSNRYSRYTEISLLVKEQVFSNRNNSTHNFQQFDRTYARFVPSLNFRYKNYQHTRYLDTWDLTLSSTYEYPSLDQLTALADSTDTYNIYLGNPLLKPSRRQQLSFVFTHDSFRPDRPLQYDLSLNVGAVRDFISDSSITYPDGRNLDYSVNLDSYRYATLKAELRKPFKFKDHTFQLETANSAGLTRYPGYINHLLAISNQFTNTTNASIRYSHKSSLALKLEESFSLYRSSLRNVNENTYISSSATSRLTASWAFLKGLTLSSNIAYSDYASSGAKSVKFTMWNASATYRFLPARNAELKFSAFDLLRQNTGSINTGSANVFVIGRTNALQQYFMLTLSWFPRKFGLK